MSRTEPPAAAGDDGPRPDDGQAAPPIRLISRRLVFENSVLRVYADHVADGQQEVPAFLSVVPTCITPDLVIGIAVLPVRAGRIGLLRVYRHALGRWQWEVPKGFIDAGEALPAAASRELLEETGLRIDADALVDLGAMAPEPGIVSSRVRLFLARIDPGVPPEARAHEMGHAEFAFFSQEEIVGMIRSNQIEDGCTQAILLRHSLPHAGDDGAVARLP